MLRTEADIVRSLVGTVTLDELYAKCEEAGVTERDGGHDVIHARTDTRWKRRVRNTLQALKQSGRARRVGEATWIIDGTRERPVRSLLVIAGDPSDITLILSAAHELLDSTDEPLDLIVADPPWALDVRQVIEADDDRIERSYVRDPDRLVDGYVDVPAGDYADFSAEWITSAAVTLRPGGHLAVITGPQAAARVQIAAEEAGLTYVNTIVVPRPFALRTTRRFAFAHTTITVLCSGQVRSARRFFSTPADLPRSRRGTEYPLDVWADVPKWERQGLMKYPAGGLHPTIVRRLVQAFTPGPDNGHAPLSGSMCDPFIGGGTSAIVAWEQQRRFLGGDVNPEALRFAMARLLDEHVYPALQAPALFNCHTGSAS